MIDKDGLLSHCMNSNQGEESLMFTVDTWRSFYTTLGIPALEQPLMHYPSEPGCSGSIIVPSMMPHDAVLDLFARQLVPFNIAVFVAPVSTQENGVWVAHTIDDLIPWHQRGAAKRTYSFPIIPHISEDDGKLIRIREFDSRMTFIECLWYNMLLVRTFGQEYLDLIHTDTQYCGGSKRNRIGPPALMWDLFDCKVSLNHHS